MTTQSFGAEFWLDNAAGTLTKLGEVVDVGRPRLTRTAIDRTHHGSPDAVQQFMKSKIKALETFTVMLRYDPSAVDVTIIEDAIENDSAVSYKTVWPSATGGREYAGEGLVLDFDPGSATVEGIFEGTITIQPDGVFTSEDAD